MMESKAKTKVCPWMTIIFSLQMVSGPATRTNPPEVKDQYCKGSNCVYWKASGTGKGNCSMAPTDLEE